MVTSPMDTVEFTYALSVLTRAYLKGLFNTRVFESAVKKAGVRFNTNQAA